MTRFLLGLLLLVGLSACADRPDRIIAFPKYPERIVSLDFCADQYVLKLADRAQILALSPDAEKAFSYMRDSAKGLPTIRPIMEDIILLKPDLVVRSYGGGPNTRHFLNRAGIPLLELGWISDIDGDGIGSVAGTITHMAQAMGHPARGQALINAYTSRLSAIDVKDSRPSALYLTPSGVISGVNTLIHEMLRAAGLENYETRPGWHPIPLEHLVYEEPDLIATAFFDTFSYNPDIWSAAKHPIARQLVKTQTVIHLEGAWTACGGWFVIDAIEALSKGVGG